MALGAAGNDEGIKLLEDYLATIGWGSYGFGLPKDIRMPRYNNGTSSPLTTSRDEL